jgi:hypothetical protein
MSPAFVTLPAFLIGLLLIAGGIGPFVFGKWLRPLRRLTAELAGMR